jgi:MFS family permease
VSGVTDTAAPGSTAVGERMTPKAWWTLAITSVAVFMVTLDNLVVTTAIPVIREDLHASLSGLQWTVNAYTLTFAVLLLTGAALGDRFGRRRRRLQGLPRVTSAVAASASGDRGATEVIPLA